MASSLGTAGAQMLPFGRLCLLTIVGLLVPVRGQSLEKVSSLPTGDPTIVNTPVLTEDPDAAHLQGPSTLPTFTWPADVQATETQSNFPETPEPVGHTAEVETQQPTGTEAFFLVTDPVPQPSSKEATPSARLSEGTTAHYHRPSPDRHDRRNDIHRQLDPDKDPFSYDVATLRKRGLLVAAVLFITGIVILTSGKCRQMSRLCQKRGRAYNVVNTGTHEKEDAAGCSYP
ncbi:FXYD domain-containing ion transport regulator 5 [Octodon degus]|uniref:FXYD domain-containing ion transport regulator n=1 Tax=Octodon degus TaxID=10160 RepID=A0A6P6EZ70_OCTDE|nr:FXYD domain-containing ion transport regulator 5 [Octodon degus]